MPYIKILFLILTSLLILPNTLKAQKNKTEIDSLSTVIQSCIQEYAPESEVLDSSFQIYDWAKEFQDYCGEVLYKKNSKVLSEIADQREVVLGLLVIKDNCEAVKKFEKELNQINKIFNKRLSDQSKESTDKQLGFQERRVVEFTVSDTRKIKAYVNSIVNRLEGDNSILRIFR